MTIERPGTDHVISGPMRGLKKTASDGADKHTPGHCDSMTESAQWGRFSENQFLHYFLCPGVFKHTLFMHVFDLIKVADQK